MIPSVDVDDGAATVEGFEGSAEAIELAEDRDSSTVFRLLGHVKTSRLPTSAVSPRVERRDC